MKNNCTYLTKDMNYYDDTEDIKCITASEAKYISSQALDNIKKKDLSNIINTDKIFQIYEFPNNKYKNKNSKYSNTSIQNRSIKF